MADFRAWSPETLAKFAEEAQAQIATQADEIKALQMRIDWLEQDRRDAIEGYRDLVRSLGVRQ